MIGELSPKISGITENVHGITGNIEHVSSVVRQKLEEFSPTLSALNQTVLNTNETVQNVNRRAHEQADRINGMVNSVLDQAVALSDALSRAAQVPVKGVAGFATTAKIRLDAVLSKLRFPRKS